MQLSSTLVACVFVAVASLLGALGAHEQDVPHLRFEDCEAVKDFSPSGILRFDGGVLDLPGDTICEEVTVRDGDVGRSPRMHVDLATTARRFSLHICPSRQQDIHPMSGDQRIYLPDGIRDALLPIRG